MVIPYSSQSIQGAEGSNCHESCQGTVWNNADEDETSKWVSVVVGEVMAFVKGKNIKTPKGKGKGKKGSEGKTNAMQVDKAGKGKGKCFECCEEGHLGGDCHVRPQRIAEGGPAIVPNNPNAKGVGTRDKCEKSPEISR